MTSRDLVPRRVREDRRTTTFVPHAIFGEQTQELGAFTFRFTADSEGGQPLRLTQTRTVRWWEWLGRRWLVREA